jgi:hypothetical protein
MKKSKIVKPPSSGTADNDYTSCVLGEYKSVKAFRQRKSEKKRLMARSYSCYKKPVGEGGMDAPRIMNVRTMMSIMESCTRAAENGDDVVLFRISAGRVHLLTGRGTVFGELLVFYCFHRRTVYSLNNFSMFYTFIMSNNL